MTIEEAIKQRHSVRSYADRPIEQEKLEALRASVDAVNLQGGLHVQLVAGDPKAFDGRLAHYGKFSGVSNYFAMIGPKGRLLDETVGYYGERLLLEAQQMGLNTCWVGLTFSKNPDVLHLADGEKLVCVIALGYGTTPGVGHKVKTIEKVTKAAAPLPDWFRRGAELALLAPTAMNQQKFTFVLRDGGCVEAKAGWGFFSKVDLGIVKYHFELGAVAGNFRWA
ncbi:MAG: nitroreductase family protein [Bacteroidaceae bacterium]|nr:nitroreductase family protein [Bacteroidaceae bacterium]